MTRAMLAIAVSVALVAVAMGAGRAGGGDTVAPALVHAWGAPPGHTGGFGEPTCRACHIEYSLNVGGELSIEGFPAHYEAGGTYLLSFILRSTEMQRAGFQAAIRFEDGRQAGVMAALDGRVRITPDSVSRIQYAHQVERAVETADPLRAAWTIEWTAPASGAPVVIHAAANSANGDNSPLGDLVYTASARAEGRQ